MAMEEARSGDIVLLAKGSQKLSDLADRTIELTIANARRALRERGFAGRETTRQWRPVKGGASGSGFAPSGLVRRCERRSGFEIIGRAIADLSKGGPSNVENTTTVVLD